MLQQPVTVVHQRETDKFKSSSASQMLVLSSIQVALGILSFVCGIVIKVLDQEGNRGLGRIIGAYAYGIWIGMLFILVGAVGIVASKKNQQGAIIASLVLNIMCSTFWCFMLMGFSAGGLVTTIFAGCRNTYYHRCDELITNAYYAMDSLMLIIGLVEFVITIWSAVLGCGAVCRCCKQSTVGYTMAYGNGTNVLHQQQIMMYPPQQQGTYPVGVHQPGQPAGYSGQPVDYGSKQAQPDGYTAHPQKPPDYLSATTSNPSEETVDQPPPAHPEKPPDYLSAAGSDPSKEEDHQPPPTAFPTEVSK